MEKGKEMPVIQKSKNEQLFTLVKQGEKVQIALGNFLISKKTFETFKDADAYIARKPYEILINVASFIAEQIIKENENTKKTEKDA